MTGDGVNHKAFTYDNAGFITSVAANVKTSVKTKDGCLQNTLTMLEVKSTYIVLTLYSDLHTKWSVILYIIN